MFDIGITTWFHVVCMLQYWIKGTYILHYSPEEARDCSQICGFLFLDLPLGDIITPDSCLFYLYLEWFNFVRKYNFDILEKNAEDRPDGVPLVTVCNHSSCLDDPCLWGKTCFSLIICLGNVFTGNYWQLLRISFWGIFYWGKRNLWNISCFPKQ